MLVSEAKGIPECDIHSGTLLQGMGFTVRSKYWLLPLERGWAVGNCLPGPNTTVEVPEPLQERGGENAKEVFEEQQGDDLNWRMVVRESQERDQRQLGGRKGIGISCKAAASSAEGAAGAQGWGDVGKPSQQSKVVGGGSARGWHPNKMRLHTASLKFF